MYTISRQGAGGIAQHNSQKITARQGREFPFFFLRHEGLHSGLKEGDVVERVVS